MTLSGYFAESVRVLERAREKWSDDLVARVLDAIANALRVGKPMLICGNGGSAADAMHITCELVGRFLLERQALNVICLSSNPSVITACANDHDFSTVFSRQVEAYGKPGGILLGISTSGNSANVVKAFEQARTMSMLTVALTGEGGGRLAPLSDFLFAVPSQSTPLIQQAHLCLYHYLCSAIERELATDQAGQPILVNAL